VTEKFIKRTFRAVETSNNNPSPGSYTAIQEQLELELQEEKRPAQVFVVNHVDMPSEN
jgi:uncharacterized protein (TIGR03435 family)